MCYRNCPIKQISLYCKGFFTKRKHYNQRWNFSTSRPGPTPDLQVQNLQASVFVERAPGGSDAFPRLRNMVCPSEMHTQHSDPNNETFNVTPTDSCWLLGDYWQYNNSRRQLPWLSPPTSRKQGLTSQCHYDDPPLFLVSESGKRTLTSVSAGCVTLLVRPDGRWGAVKSTCRAARCSPSPLPTLPTAFPRK